MEADFGGQQLGKITAQSLAAKYRGKKELFNLLTVDVGLYLPHYKTINVYFIKALLMKSKRAIKTAEVQYIYAPQYSELSVEKILAFASQFAEISSYMPEERDIPQLPRQWILNVCNTVIGRPFAVFVKERVECRNESLAQRQDLNIAVDPEILEVIQASSAVSTLKGNSAHLLKIGTKRRRTRAEIDEFRQAQENQLLEVADKEERIQELERQLLKSKSKLQSAEKAESLVVQMMDAGALVEDEHGTFSIKQQ